jgi:hypothetical protein
MNTELETELRAAFEKAAEPVTPPADLAHRVRKAARRKLAVVTTAAATVLAAVGCAAGVLVIGQPAPSRLPPDHGTAASRVIVRLLPDQDVAAMAVSGPYLYVATEFAGNRPYALAAYTRSTGRLLRRVTVPAEPDGLTAGPEHSVWLTFSPDQGGGPCGTWLLTTDLGRRSAASGCSTGAMLPTGSTTALTGGRPDWLGTLAMPPPGHPGRAAFTPSAKIGSWAVGALARVGSRVAALLLNDGGNDHVVIAGQRHLSFGGRSGPLVQSEAGQAGNLWVTTESPTGAGYNGPLLELSARLRPITPTAITANPVLRHSEQVWSDANTLWVATASPTHRLICFTNGTRPGPLITIPVHGDIAGLATAGHTVYLTLANSATVIGGGDVFAYPIPPRCR